MSSPAVALPRFEPMLLARLHAPFDHPDWLHEEELKYDGWRALAYIGNGKCRLVSRQWECVQEVRTIAETVYH